MQNKPDEKDLRSVNMLLSTETVNRAEALQRKLGVKALADVVATALKAAEYMVDAKAKGHRILLDNGESQKEVLLAVPKK